jgi:hypothetical protein
MLLFSGCAGVLGYSLTYASASPIGLPITPSADSQVNAHWHNYLLLALVISLVTFIVQGLHHHEKVGVFPEIRALLGLSPSSASYSSYSSIPPPALGSEFIKSDGKATLTMMEGEGRGMEKDKLRLRQVFSTWGEGAK